MAFTNFFGDQSVKKQSTRWVRASRHAPSLVSCHVVDLGTGGPAARRLIVSDGSSLRLVPVHLILWAEARAGRVSVHSAEGQLTIGGTLASLTHALGAGFQQITRNTTVNMNAVAEIRRRSRQRESAVVLNDGQVLPVSRLYASVLRLWLTRHTAVDHTLSTVRRSLVATETKHHPVPEESPSPALPAHSA
jgi:DNA-binding LytR/AlgR family response regulator